MITVIGLGADGWASLSDSAKSHVAAAGVVFGGRRHLELLPAFSGQRREPWPSPLRENLPGLLATINTDQRVAVLASGDPLVSGIASTLIDHLGPDAVTVLPALSSVTLARAALRWPAESCTTVSLVGRDVAQLKRQLAPGRRILVLSADESTPAAVAQLLVSNGYAASRLTVLGELGNPHQSVTAYPTARALLEPGPSQPRLNIVAIECDGPSVGGWVAGLPDQAFENDGQLTKRDLRASALARLSPHPGEHLWDVGAGAGSIGIEWMRAHRSCTATAIEASGERSERIRRNAVALGVPGLQVVHGAAPQALRDLPVPAAIFVGGGATRPGVIEACLAALTPGGRLVAHGVTLETEHLLGRLYGEHGGELTRIAVEVAEPIGTFTGWSPARAVTAWAYRV